MAQPALLRGRHRQRHAVVPTPGALDVPGQAIGGGRDVAATVLGADRHIDLTLERHERGLQQPALDTIRKFVAALLDGQCAAVIGAQDRTDGSCGLALGCEGQWNEDPPVRQRDPLGAAAGIDGRAARVVPLDSGGLRELSVRRANDIDRIPLQLRPREAPGLVVIDVVADRQDGVGHRVVFRHDVTDPFCQVVAGRMTSESGDLLRRCPGSTQVLRHRPMHVAKHVGAGNGLQGHECDGAGIARDHTGARMEPRGSARSSVPEDGAFDLLDAGGAVGLARRPSIVRCGGALRPAAQRHCRHCPHEPTSRGRISCFCHCSFSTSARASAPYETSQAGNLRIPTDWPG